MKSDKLPSFKAIHGAVIGTVLSVAVTVALSATLALPVDAFAASATAAHPAHAKKKAAAARVSSKEKSREAASTKVARAKTGAAARDDERPVVRHRRVTVTLNGHHRNVRRVAFEPRQSVGGEAFGLHEASGALMLRSSVAFVVDQNSLEPLFDKNSRSVVPIASISKLMTAMVVLDSKAPLDEPITVSDEDRDFDKNTGSRLSVGSVLSREDMLHIALMASENRAAAALSRYYPGGRPAFIAAMNAKAKQLGMTDTHFENSTGLSSQNVSTARDLVKMVNAAYQYPLIRKFSTDRSYDVFTGKRNLAYNSTNALIRNPSWDIGLQKTGFINEAGECLVMQTTIHGRPVIMVLLDSTGKYSRFADANRMRAYLDTLGDQPRITSADAGGAGT
ncbi:MAG TPA: D-alanyl-D-alanine endopeptidase [Paraburkholderia sp.]|jgi:D-alanyl-D-alanine endopeptidase (penicillin-binding protein 7)|nr:D-alanyl-D-alanine endopeptidase [Paraburkholderia sp.]